MSSSEIKKRKERRVKKVGEVGVGGGLRGVPFILMVLFMTSQLAFGLEGAGEAEE